MVNVYIRSCVWDYSNLSKTLIAIFRCIAPSSDYWLIVTYQQ